MQTMGRQFLQGDAVGNSVPGLTKAQADNIPSLSLVHQAGHLLAEDQVAQAGPALPEPLAPGCPPLAAHSVSPAATLFPALRHSPRS